MDTFSLLYDKYKFLIVNKINHCKLNDNIYNKK